MRTAIQLYTLRELDGDTAALLRRVGKTGFDGVEFAGIDGETATVRAALRETGLAVAGAHVGIEAFEERFAETIEEYRDLGCDTLVVPSLDPTHFETRAATERTARRLSALAARANEAGVRFCYHSHDHEFVALDEESGTAFDVLAAESEESGTAFDVLAAESEESGTAFDVLAAESEESGTAFDVLAAESEESGTAFDVLAAESEELQFELDLGWVAGAGYDPIEVLDRIGDRVPLVHLKDVRVTDRTPVELGAGDLAVDDCVAAAREAGVEWLVYEHDRPAEPKESLRCGAERLATF